MDYQLAQVLNQPCLHIRIWQEDNVYVAQCLDIPGCVSQGETRDEALANVHEAIRLCLEVIREEAGHNPIECETHGFEVIEQPMSEFVQTL